MLTYTMLLLHKFASTNSNYVDQYNIPGHFAPIADFELVTKAKNVADQIGATTHVGNVLSSDTFYNADPTFNDAWKKWVF